MLSGKTFMLCIPKFSNCIWIRVLKLKDIYCVMQHRQEALYDLEIYVMEGRLR